MDRLIARPEVQAGQPDIEDTGKKGRIRGNTSQSPKKQDI